MNDAVKKRDITQLMTPEQRKAPVNTVPAKMVKEFFNKHKSGIQEALPAHIRAERLITLAMTLIKKDSELAKCSADTMYGALIKCAHLGLEPVDGMNEVSLVAFKGKVQVIVGYAGLIKLATQNKLISGIKPVIIRENDEYYYEEGLNETLKHIPARGDRGAPIAYYSVAKMADGNSQFCFMFKEEVQEEMQKISAMKNGRAMNVWQNHFDAMAMKTTIRRLVKYLPRSVELADALVMENNTEMGKSNTYTVDDYKILNESELDIDNK